MEAPQPADLKVLQAQIEASAWEAEAFGIPHEDLPGYIYIGRYILLRDKRLIKEEYDEVGMHIRNFSHKDDDPKDPRIEMRSVVPGVMDNYLKIGAESNASLQRRLESARGLGNTAVQPEADTPPDTTA